MVYLLDIRLGTTEPCSRATFQIPLVTNFTSILAVEPPDKYLTGCSAELLRSHLSNFRTIRKGKIVVL